jgi:hypothetical protein
LCHDADSSPPVAAEPVRDVAAHDHVLVSADGTRLAAYTSPHGFFDVAYAEHLPAVDDAWRRVLRFLATPAPRSPDDLLPVACRSDVGRAAVRGQ